MTLQEKWFFGYRWLRSGIRAQNKLSEAEQLLGLFQCNLLFALYQSSSLNSHSKPEINEGCTWTSQDFSSWLAGSNLLCAVSAYGMGKEGQKSSGLSLACPRLLLVTCCDGRPMDWPALAKMLHKMKILIKIFVGACSIMSF